MGPRATLIHPQGTTERFGGMQEGADGEEEWLRVEITKGVKGSG